MLQITTICTLFVVATSFHSASGDRRALEVEPNHSTIGFSVPIVAGVTRVTGKFTEFDVDLDFDDEDVTNSSVTATIKAASIDTGIDDRDKDLQGPTFFDVENHPDITFQSKRIEKGNGGYVAIGDFSMRGVTKEIELPFQVINIPDPSGESSFLGVSVRWSLDRQVYGVGSNFKHTLIDNFIGDEVTIELDVWWTREREE